MTTMTSPQADKGARWERAIVHYLRAVGFRYAERAYGAGRPDDRGDIDGFGAGWLCVSAKDQKRWSLSAWLDEVQEQTANAEKRTGVVVVKRARRPVNDAYCVMRLEDFAGLVKELDGHRPPTTVVWSNLPVTDEIADKVATRPSQNAVCGPLPLGRHLNHPKPAQGRTGSQSEGTG